MVVSSPQGDEDDTGNPFDQEIDKPKQRKKNEGQRHEKGDQNAVIVAGFAAERPADPQHGNDNGANESFRELRHFGRM